MKKFLPSISIFSKIEPRVGHYFKKHRVIKWSCITVIGITGLLSVFCLYIAYLLPLPQPLQINQNIPTTKIYDRNGALLYEVLRPETGKVSLVQLDLIPKNLLNATIAAEDIHYYEHPGVDIGAIARALFFNTRENRVVSGGSTITQQLVRNLLAAENRRDLQTKLIEAIYAIRISHAYSKDQILEMYLNTIYYGNMSYGVQTASRDYFNKNVSDLDLAQAAFLAGLPQSPSQYNPFTNFQNAKKRQKYVLQQMVKYGMIQQSEADAASDETIVLRANRHNIRAPHFVMHIIDELTEKYGEKVLMEGGLKVYTTLDLSLQQKAESIIERQITALSKNNVNSAGLLSLDPRNGQILAWVGSRNYFNDEIDGAVDMVTALRQPGSSIKPLTYLAAFEKGYTPATIIFDIPTQFDTQAGPYSPKNYDLDYHGPVRARTALASSYNIPAVKTLEYVGVGNFISFLSRFGIDTLSDGAEYYGLALTLGGGEVRLYDMAQAYSVLANYGEKKPLSDILKIEDAAGKTVFSFETPVSTYVLGKDGRQHAYQIIDIIKDPNARIPGFGENSVLEINREAAVKTGTTRNFRDNWTIGFTPDLLTAVWVGNADAKPMENISGVDGAAPIWADFTTAALEGKPRLTFSRPDRLVTTDICAISGVLPGQYCQETIRETFVKGSTPVKVDDYYKKVLINTQTGKIIPTGCEKNFDKAQIKEKIIIDYPAAIQRWAFEKGLNKPQNEYCPGQPDYPDGYPGAYADESAAALKLDTPANLDEYKLTNELPIQDQKIPFRAAAPTGTVSIDYIIDGEKVGTVSEPPFTYLWLPIRGIHTLKAIAIMANGKTSVAIITFIVK